MCGIVGMVTKSKAGFSKQDQEVFRSLLFVDSLRGEDSIGVFGVRKSGNVDFLKSATDPSSFLKTKSYQTFDDNIFSKFKMVVGHNRKATQGSIKDENAHPFVEKNVILVHNGTLFNHRSSLKDVEVDSHAICHSIAEVGYKETLKRLQGAYALSWYDADSKTLSLVRNKERPLSIIETPSTWFFASENLMLYWLLIRHGFDVNKIKQIEVKPHELHFFTVDESDVKHTEKVEEVNQELVKKHFMTIVDQSSTGTSTTNKVSEKNSIIKNAKFSIGETILCKVKEVVEYDINSIVDSPDAIRGYIQCNEVYTQSVVKIYFTSKSLERYLATDSEHLNVVIQSIVGSVQDKALTYFSNYYTVAKPIYDCQGAIISGAVFSNIEDTRCRHCNTIVKYVDIRDSRIRYQNRTNTKITCPDCIKKMKEKHKK